MNLVVSSAVKLAASAEIGEQIEKALATGGLRIPNRRMINEIGTRISNLDSLFMRERMETHAFARYLQSDSSRQGKHNFLIVLEDHLFWRKGATVAERFELDMDSNIVQRHGLLTTLGDGCSGRSWKAVNTSHSVCIETGTAAKYHEHRLQILTWTSDQGDDIWTPKSPLLVHDNFDAMQTLLADLRRGDADLSAFSGEVLAELQFMPNCVVIPDAEHAMFGGFEAVVTSDDEYRRLEDGYTTLAHLLGNNDLKKQVCRNDTCIPEQP